MRTFQSLLRILLAGELREHFGRIVISVIAIAIGVAMGYAIHLINHAALIEFSRATRVIMGEADLEIRGPRNGFDEALYARLSKLPQVDAASPVVEINAYLPEHGETLKLLGVDVFRAREVSPGLIGSAARDKESSLIYLDPATIFLSPSALSWLKVKPDDTLTVQAGLTTLPLRIAGALPVTNESVRLGVMDIGAAQWYFGQLGLVQRINLRIKPGVDIKTFQQTLKTILPAGVVAITPEDSQRTTSNLSRAYRVNLDVLALVALFTGAFLVFSTQALSVIRRRPQLALLRALGMTRSELLGLILAEGIVQGVIGAILGVMLGLVLATAVLHYAGGDLGGGYFPGLRPTVHFDVITAMAFAALGTAASLLGSFAPAWEAARARPAQALKAGDEEVSIKNLRTTWPALATIAAGIALTQAKPVAGLPVFGYLAIGLLLAGAILLMPRLAQGIFAVLPGGRRVVAYLALAQLTGAPGRAAIGLAGIVASFSLMAAMAIMVTSFRVSFDQWLDIQLPAQLYLRASVNGDSGHFSDADQKNISATPGIDRVEFMRTDRIILDPGLPPVAWVAKPIDRHNPAARLALLGSFIKPAVDGPPPIWISEAMVDLYGMYVGEHINLPVAGQLYLFVVAGVWRDYARQYGAIMINLDDYRRLSHDPFVTDAALWLAPGFDTAQAIQSLRQRLANASQIEFIEADEIRSASLRIFDRSFAVTYLLEFVAIIIGLSGIGASFGAQALARSREFGMLRHIGVMRRQIGAMLALEGALLGVLGVSVGLVLGWGIALILIHVVNPQSFHWTMNLHIPWATLLAAAVAMVAAASLTAVASGQRAMSATAIRAVREDW